ncbi:MAG: nucleoside triphosphate pyrophosphohydrolase [Bacteroidales bacterium]|jgi:XTP/dITP diphosphohydrolase|nr:nucleoside triphosphate pyrophosphohydrolase [Bacteroidales bacterium]MBR0314667.1 nucleoside triphosphate pyrophosphohydrolase [Bacteroidales bacterium]
METKRERELAAFERLLDVMDTLREKCPWDHKQTLETLRPQTIEETYELSDAILKKDMFNISKELGDLLLHVVFYAKIGKEQGEFDIADVCNKLCDKLIYRHPHIYGDVRVKNAEEVVGNWEQLKTKEKDGNKSVLSGVPDSLPSVIKAYRIQEKARAVGFDWEKKEDVWNKVAEEFSEFKEALGKGGKEAQEELGDFLFSVINAARLYDINPDTALEDTCSKFRRRFGYLEQNTIKQGKSLKDMTLAQMDEYWDKAKELERKGEL